MTALDLVKKYALAHGGIGPEETVRFFDDLVESGVKAGFDPDAKEGNSDLPTWFVEACANQANRLKVAKEAAAKANQTQAKVKKSDKPASAAA